jgi:hypothetical protein
MYVERKLTFDFVRICSVLYTHKKDGGRREEEEERKRKKLVYYSCDVNINDKINQKNTLKKK